MLPSNGARVGSGGQATTHFDDDDHVCIEPPEDVVAPDILFLNVPEATRQSQEQHGQLLATCGQRRSRAYGAVTGVLVLRSVVHGLLGGRHPEPVYDVTL